MKTVFLYLLLAVFALQSYAQDPTSKINLTEVVVVDSTLKKDELFSRARKWFADSFVNSNNVLRVNDKESGELIGQGTFPGEQTRGLTTDKFTISFDVNIYVKDGRYKYEVTDIRHSCVGSYSTNGSGCVDMGVLLNSKEKVIEGMRYAKMNARIYKSQTDFVYSLVSQETGKLITSLKKAMSGASGTKDW